MTMIEKVANAICKRRNDDDWPCNGLDFDMEMARVAIEAMRNANAKMIRAGLPRATDGYPIDVWHAMIDAALKD